MRAAVKKVIAVGSAIGLVASSTSAAAANSTPATAATGYEAPNAWVMLTALSPSTASVLGSAAPAVQPTDVAPPPPAIAAAGGVAFGELLPIALWFGLIAVAFAATDDGGREAATGNPNSPP
ncbi:MAG TPA: hypothetical protein VF750_01525 [Sphingomicrobium sp.]